MLATKETRWVLRGINFSIDPGRILGVIGKNGAGKSTLLQIIAGIMYPNEGSGEVQGRVAALLNIGAGFHPDLTGRENVIVAGIVGGLTRREISSQLDSIQDFAEIFDAIDDPFHTYSSGMRMRLMFALAIHLQPDVILIDEVLSVGDIAFQHKCFQRILDFKSRGCAILLATHDLDLSRRFCDELLWLDGAGVMDSGDPNRVADRYLASMQSEQLATKLL
jgi:lipopolysaccharide transport system ATP-binding protein